jgi:hypothetical protein
MSVSSNAKNHVNKDEKRRIKRTYKRNYRSPIIRPIAITAFGIASIITAVMMLSSGAYFVAYTSSIHAKWYTLQLQSSYWLTNVADLIPSSLMHVTEANIAAFGVIAMALAAVPAIVSFGLFRGRSWSWNASIIFFAIASASLLLTIGSGGEGSGIQVQGQGIAANSIVQSLLYAGLSIAVLYYLTRARVKTFFGKNATTDDSRNSMQHQSPTMPSARHHEPKS